MNQTPFIGIGHNPEGPDLPLGLGMQLAQDPKAMDTFGRMSRAQKSELIAFVQGATTGDEAKQRMTDALARLHSGF